MGSVAESCHRLPYNSDRHRFDDRQALERNVVAFAVASEKSTG